MAPETSAPLSQPIRVETIKPRGSHARVTATGDVLAKIARALDLASLESLEARYELARNGERVKLEGEIVAELHQTCIVTLEPFPVRLKVPLKLDFAPEAEVLAAAQRQEEREEKGEIDLEIMLNEADPPEPIIDGMVDLGTITVEFLSLALDPYPRKPGASFDTELGTSKEESPFAVLAKLKRGE
ncbi:DUF177 domain-containing protein [Bosea caraganae]|uniref:DUF177 domain-containing protein n=1 Tax=Bosea caraganae TaxID=2763117 RepID=A0A370L736_9HYPH|nr:DUF177 domain-containing protein [Bosea caraganae]RDJ23274.1 DUF177 domain-containing protein [Bosea caraganae]RDJ24613.1 DUF177 domain-containing protein [Bosea caraganae]